jgi:hypothetical protein
MELPAGREVRRLAHAGVRSSPMRSAVGTGPPRRRVPTIPLTRLRDAPAWRGEGEHSRPVARRSRAMVRRS